MQRRIRNFRNPPAAAADTYSYTNMARMCTVPRRFSCAYRARALLVLQSNVSRLHTQVRAFKYTGCLEIRRRLARD